MGLILDSSLFIAEERGRFDMPRFLKQFPNEQPAIASITASELLHGVERADTQARKQKRSSYVEQVLSRLLILPFDLAVARVHAQLWADLSTHGITIGPHDLQIAATAQAFGWPVATLNAVEFQRITSLKVINAQPFRR
jgi:predicted nucleic acid-binding protein